MEGGNWSGDVNAIAHNGVLISKKAIKPHWTTLTITLPDINYFDKVIRNISADKHKLLKCY